MMQSQPPTAWPFPTAELMPALELVTTLTRSTQAVLLLKDGRDGSLRPAVGLGLDPAEWPVLDQSDCQNELLARAMAHRRRVVVQGPEEQTRILDAVLTPLHARMLEILPLLDGDGPVLGVIVLFSQRSHPTRPRLLPLVDECLRLVVRLVKHAERRAAAERAKADWEQSAEARARFFARMSHELRSPLQSIAGYIDLLRLGVPDPLTASQERMLARVQHNEEQLVRVIDDLILFARLGTGRVQFRIKMIAANHVMEVAERVVGPLAAAHEVRFSVEPCRRLAVLADADRLKQILANVGAHAVKSCAPHGTVQIGCRVEEQWGVFEIRDDSAGYSAEQLRVLFEPYVAPDEPVLDRGDTGLGLAISRELAAGMRGQLTAANLPERGVVFALRLPLPTAPSEAGYIGP